jgi:hypothetical protein
MAMASSSDSTDFGTKSVESSDWWRASCIGSQPYNSQVQFVQLKGNDMPRLRFDSLTTDGRSEMIRNADIIVLFGSAESEKAAWSWNLELPRLSMPGSKPHEPRTLELIVDSPEQLAAAEALVLLIREGIGAAK